MTGQVQHLRNLIARLEDRYRALGDPIRPDVAAELMDLLLRCRGFSTELFDEAGTAESLASVAAKLVPLERALLEAAGQGVDLEDLWQRGLGLLERGDPDGAKAWGLDLLRTANLAPVIPGDRGQRARAVVQRCLDLASSEPRSFLGAAELALERWELEPIDALDPFAKTAHQALEALPLEAVIDASALPLSPEQQASLLDPIRRGTVLKPGTEALPALDQPWTDVIRPREQQLAATVSPAEQPGFWADLLERADAALLDARSWKQELFALLSKFREPDLVWGHADRGRGEMVRLGRFVEEDWWLVHDSRGLSVRGPRQPEVQVTAHLDDEKLELERTETSDAAFWTLPAAERWIDGLGLSVQVGPDRFTIELPGQHSET